MNRNSAANRVKQLKIEQLSPLKLQTFINFI